MTVKLAAQLQEVEATMERKTVRGWDGKPVQLRGYQPVTRLTVELVSPLAPEVLCPLLGTLVTVVVKDLDLPKPEPEEPG